MSISSCQNNLLKVSRLPSPTSHRNISLESILRALNICFLHPPFKKIDINEKKSVWSFCDSCTDTYFIRP